MSFNDASAPSLQPVKAVKAIKARSRFSIAVVDGIWLMTTFIREVPRELEEAARIDGCGTLQVLWRVIVPVVMPGIAATAILVFVHSWNEFVVALNLTARQTATVPVAIAKYAQEHETKYGEMAAGAVLSTFPALFLLFFAQRHIVRGLTAGAVK